MVTAEAGCVMLNGQKAVGMPTTERGRALYARERVARSRAAWECSLKAVVVSIEG